jgi:hypothetical protein
MKGIMENELKTIEKQLQFALDELNNERSDKQLMHNWINESLYRVRKLLISNERDIETNDLNWTRLSNGTSHIHTEVSTLNLDKDMLQALKELAQSRIKNKPTKKRF